VGVEVYNEGGQIFATNFGNLTLVPEPSTLTLLAAGLLAAMRFRRRRHASPQA
jgi:hypothetical protein